MSVKIRAVSITRGEIMRSDSRNVLQILAEWGETDLLEGEGGFSLNVFTTPLDKAREYAQGVFERAGKDLDQEIPNFDANYEALRAKGKVAMDVPRIQMPVIEPSDMDEFDKVLKSGSIDIFAPYAKGKLDTPPSMSKEEGAEWIRMGLPSHDKGSAKDDVINAQWTRRAARDLKPTQKQIWLEKLVGNIVKFGIPKVGSPVLETTIIVSKEGYILDGHHRFGQVMLGDPSLKLRALVIPLDIDVLLKVGKSYGEAIGNAPKGRLRESRFVDEGVDLDTLYGEQLAAASGRLGGKPVQIGSYKLDGKIVPYIGFAVEKSGAKIYVKFYVKSGKPQLLISRVGPTVVDVVNEPLDPSWKTQIDDRAKYALTMKIGRPGW